MPSSYAVGNKLYKGSSFEDGKGMVFISSFTVVFCICQQITPFQVLFSFWRNFEKKNPCKVPKHQSGERYLKRTWFWSNEFHTSLIYQSAGNEYLLSVVWANLGYSGEVLLLSAVTKTKLLLGCSIGCTSSCDSWEGLISDTARHPPCCAMPLEAWCWNNRLSKPIQYMSINLVQAVTDSDFISYQERSIIFHVQPPQRHPPCCGMLLEAWRWNNRLSKPIQYVCMYFSTVWFKRLQSDFTSYQEWSIIFHV